MKINIKKNYLLLALICLTHPLPASFATSDFSSVNDPKTRLTTMSCPEIKHIKLDNNRFWTSGKHWRSNERSFVKKLTVFIGAQWSSQGTNIGQIICVYSVKQAQQLPTMMYFNTMAQRPLSGAWAPPRTQRNERTPSILNCAGANLSPSSCAFPVRVSISSTKSLYEQALELKKGEAPP